MQQRSEDAYLPRVMSLNPSELINWCKKRKQFLGLSNQRLAEESGVPVGTIDRIMAGKYTEFRYSSIQLIAAVLIGIREDTPKPGNAGAQQMQDYYDTIEGFHHSLTLLVSFRNTYLPQGSEGNTIHTTTSAGSPARIEILLNATEQ